VVLEQEKQQQDEHLAYLPSIAKGRPNPVANRCLRPSFPLGVRGVGGQVVAQERSFGLEENEGTAASASTAAGGVVTGTSV
jgi:hypothetical protein